MCCIALLGVWNWRGRNELNSLTVLPDWDEIALKKRRIFIVFDSDARQNKQVFRALVRLKRFLEYRGGNVSVVELPDAEIS